MSLPILSSNTIQAMVTPWCTYRGQQAYDNTNLAPLLSMPKIQDVACDVVAGKTSNSGYTLEGTTYQSKYDPNWYICFTSSTEAVIFSSKYSHTEINFTHPILQIIDESLDKIYFTYEELKFSSGSTDYCFCGVIALNKQTNTITPIQMFNAYNIPAFYCIEESQNTYLFAATNGSGFSNTGYVNLMQYNYTTNSSSTVRTYKYTDNRYSYYNDIRYSKVVDGYFYGGYTNGSIWYLFKASIDSSSLYQMKCSESFSLYNSSVYKQVFPTKDKEGNIYISLYENYISNQSGRIRVYTTEGWSSDLATIPTISAVQTINSISHLVVIDEENLLVGNGTTISRLQWNKNTISWETKSTFDVNMVYNYFCMDIAGRIWVRGDSTIVRILPGQGVNLMCSFEKDTYLWEGQNINTMVTLSILDQIGNPVTTDQKVHLYGNITFEDGSQTKVLSFDKVSELSIPVTITGVGSMDCLLEF